MAQPAAGAAAVVAACAVVRLDACCRVECCRGCCCSECCCCGQAGWMPDCKQLHQLRVACKYVMSCRRMQLRRACGMSLQRLCGCASYYYRTGTPCMCVLHAAGLTYWSRLDEQLPHHLLCNLQQQQETGHTSTHTVSRARPADEVISTAAAVPGSASKISCESVRVCANRQMQ